MKKIVYTCMLACGLVAQARSAEGAAVETGSGVCAKFALSLKQKPAGKARLVRFAEADDIRRRNLPGGDEEILYTYRDAAAPVREARVTLRKAPDGAVRSKLSCEMNPGWFLERTMFPVIEIPCEKATRLMLGSNKGGVYHDPVNWKNGRGCFCASPGSCCAQFAAAWNDAEGLYLGMEDAKGYMKTIGFARTANGIRFVHYEKVWTTGSYTQDYWIVSRRVEKGAEPLTWYDFADIYKAWDRKQAWSRTPFLARTDIPAWMKDAPAFTRFSRQWIGRPEAIRKFADWWKRDIGNKPVVAALWGWEKVGTWWGPDYFPCHPSDEVFTATMKELRGRNFHPFAWPSGYNWSKVIGDKGDGTYEWDGRERFIKPAEGHLVVNEDGSLYHMPAFWLRNGALTTICGGDPWSHDWWNGITKELARRGCDIVQVDQVVGGKIRTCWSTGHGHPVGDGIWMWQTFRRQLEEMHAAIKSVEPDALVGVEEPNMMYNDLVGIQDYRNLESDADEFASVYSYLYHGYVPMFQSNPFRDEFFSLAHAATDGQMPFYKPDFAELEPSRPALQNGGFEDLIDSVRGPSGWDRLIPNRLLRGVDAGKPLWNFAGYNNMGWLGYGVTLEYGDKHDGEVSLRFDVPAKGGRDNGQPIQVSQTIDGLEPGEYTVSAWVKSLNVTPSGRDALPRVRTGTLKSGRDALPRVRTGTLKSGRDALPRVRTGSLKYGTRAGEQGEIAFPAEGGWTNVSAKVRTGTQLRLIVWAPPGAKFLVDDVKLTRDGKDVVVSGDSPYTRFMKKWIALYQGEGKDFLANGFQVKPPALQCDMFSFAARRERAVCFAAYESASGERALALANATDKPQRVVGRWEGRSLDMTLAPYDIQFVKRKKRLMRFRVEMDDGGGFCRKVGETVAVSARVKGKKGKAVNNGTVEAWVDDGWTNVVWRRSVDLAKEPVVKISLSRSTPGTLRIHLRMPGVREKMDRVVFGQAEIRPLTPYPEDFESYWRGELAKLKREVPIAVEKTPAPDLGTAEHDVFRVSFATFNGKRVYGFLSVPKGKGPFPVCVSVPGAGSGVVAPSSKRTGWINLTMNMHGFPIGRTKKEQKARYDAWLSDLQARSGEPKYQRFGFATGRDKPIYHDIVTGMVRALDWLADEPYADASRFVYCGCSQGGGFGIYLTSLWGRFRKSLIICPNMCDMLAYKAGRQPGSEHIMEQTPEHRPAAELTGPYYDACNFARLIRTPVRMVYGLSDDNCNTGGGIAAFNVLGCADKELRLLPGLGHGWYPSGFDTWLFDL